MITEGRAGGGPTVAATITKFKMQPDEALKILNIEKSNLNRNIVEEVTCCASFLTLSPYLLKYFIAL